MQLGKPKKQNEAMKELYKENLMTKNPTEAFAEEEKEEQASFNPLAENVMVDVEEKINCTVNKDGEVDKFQVKGIVYVTINDPKKNNPLVQVQYQPIKGFVFKPHPDLDKQSWNK